MSRMLSEVMKMRRIESYSFGAISVDGNRYTSDLIIYPGRVESGWWRKEGHRLHIEDIPEVLKNPPEVLVVGRGDSARLVVDAEVEKELQRREIKLVAEPTKAACERFNELSREGKHVVAALHLTC